MNSSVRSLWPGTASCPKEQLLGAVGCQPRLTSGSAQEALLTAQHRLFRQGHILPCRAHKISVIGHLTQGMERDSFGRGLKCHKMSRSPTDLHLCLFCRAGCQSCTDPALSWAQPPSQHSAVGPHPPVPVPHIPFTQGLYGTQHVPL